MIVGRRGFIKGYTYSGSGIFDTIANFLTRIRCKTNRIFRSRCREKRS